MVTLYKNEESCKDIVQEYELNASSLDKWIIQFRKSGSFKVKDNELQKSRN